MKWSLFKFVVLYRASDGFIHAYPTVACGPLTALDVAIKDQGVGLELVMIVDKAMFGPNEMFRLFLERPGRAIVVSGGFFGPTQEEIDAESYDIHSDEIDDYWRPSIRGF